MLWGNRMKRYFLPEERVVVLDIDDSHPMFSTAIEISRDEHCNIVAALNGGEEFQLVHNEEVSTITANTIAYTSTELVQQRISEIQQQLTANDLASVRPLRAKVAGTATPEDEARLVELEAQAQVLRTELATLNIKLQELSDQPTE